MPEIDGRPELRAEQQLWLVGNRPIPTGKEGNGVRGRQAEVEEEARRPWARGFRAGAAGMTGAAPALLSARPWLMRGGEGGRGKGIGSRANCSEAGSIRSGWWSPPLYRVVCMGVVRGTKEQVNMEKGLKQF